MKEIWNTHIVRVNYADTDQMGVVHHGNYVNWFEIARTEWMRTNGIPYSAMESKGLLLPVLNLDVHYKKSATYDVGVALYATVRKFSAIRLEFYYEARKIADTGEALPKQKEVNTKPEGDLLATGNTAHMWLNEHWKPVRIDKKHPEIYTMLEEKLS